MASAAASNKAKIARRVIEVLEFFDDEHREATVMDIVRRYDRPQSSTSELLSSLVELGLLYKDPYSRCYTLAARAALLGTAGQAEAVRDGRLVRMIDRLASQTGLMAALFGQVGMRVQLVMLRHGGRADAAAFAGLHGGMQVPLSQSDAGLLLLSTLGPRRCEGVLRRLNAEAAADAKFALAEIAVRVDACRSQGHVHGRLGFGSGSRLLATLMPGQPEDHPLAIGLVHRNDDAISRDALLSCLREAASQYAAAPAATVEQLPTAA